MTDKLALITGASRGLGAALAEALVPDYHILAVARTTGALEELDDRVKARGGAATLAPMDVTVPPAMGTLAQGIMDRWGHLDLWVHTAIHAAPLTPADHLGQKDWEKSVAVNANATAMLIPLLSPLLRAAPKGQAVFFDDPQAKGKYFGAYGATKAAQIALARSWVEEAPASGLKVHILTPNPMPTALRARFHPGEDRDALSSPEIEANRLAAILKG